MSRHKHDKLSKAASANKGSSLKKGPAPKPRSLPKAARGAQPPSPHGAFWLFGRHPVLAAIANPLRRIHRLVATPQQAESLNEALKKRTHETKRPPLEIIDAADFDRLVSADSLHQGLAAQVLPLDDLALDDICRIEPGETGNNLVLVLDQVTDPHNVGAIIRSAAAFGARALVTTDRHAPPETGALAKSASGTLETLPWVRVTNLSRALEDLAELGYWRVGLDGRAKHTVDEVEAGRNIALVLGSEGAGLRHGTVEHCDFLARLPISPSVESLNVSNAAAVALYAFSRRS